MKTWIIEPRDSLIVRDGRPFGLGAGIRATSLDFPFPSTTTGGVRTRAGLNDDGMFDVNSIDAVKEIATAGPLLIELDQDAVICDWLMPAPCDALIVRDESDEAKVQIRCLKPINDAESPTNIETSLLPVGVRTLRKGKPARGPKFWHWMQFKEWLIESKDFSACRKALGHDGPDKDSRVHASLNESFTTGTTGENNLFQTRGLEFRRTQDGEKLQGAKRLALAIFVQDSAHAQNIKTGVAPLGGERRLVVWREDIGDKAKDILLCPDLIKSQIINSRCCRLVLLTPAFFNQGSYPNWILQPHKGVTAKLKAIAHNHYQVVSGWDFAKVQTKNNRQIVGEPKPTRRLVPAGAVLFLELAGNNIGEWIDYTWFRCISDDDPTGPPNPRHDGFGLAMLGTWDGISLKME